MVMVYWVNLHEICSKFLGNTFSFLSFFFFFLIIIYIYIYIYFFFKKKREIIFI
jgi:hypothetical protein